MFVVRHSCCPISERDADEQMENAGFWGAKTATLLLIWIFSLPVSISLMHSYIVIEFGKLIFIPEEKREREVKKKKSILRVVKKSNFTETSSSIVQSIWTMHGYISSTHILCLLLSKKKLGFNQLWAIEGTKYTFSDQRYKEAYVLHLFFGKNSIQTWFLSLLTPRVRSVSRLSLYTISRFHVSS